MKFTYKHTVLTCYLAYISSAAANNIASLLFIIFKDDFGLSTVQLATVITLNFITQIAVDLFGAKFVDRIGYRKIAVISSSFLIIGMVFLGILPIIFENTFASLCIAACVYAIGSGLYEVIISPIVEALPGEQKEGAMSILHSFYCWGHLAVILLSTLYLSVLPQIWYLLPVFWAIMPTLTLLMFCFVPIRTLNESAPSMKLRKLFSTRLFFLFMLLMICGGAAEMTMAQWASLFAESALGVSKAIGNLLGPAFFALMMAITRTFYGKNSEKLPLLKALIIASFFTVSGYLMVSLIPNKYIALIGCGLVGIGVAMYWPGTLSIAAKALPAGGASMFAILALCGDVGCSVGPQITAFVSDAFGSNMKAGLLFAVIFPIVIIASLAIYTVKSKHLHSESKS